MIHKVKDAYVISSYGVWRPGAYDSERTARYAFRFDDEELAALMKKKQTITYQDLKELRKRTITTILSPLPFVIQPVTANI